MTTITKPRETDSYNYYKVDLERKVKEKRAIPNRSYRGGIIDFEKIDNRYVPDAGIRVMKQAHGGVLDRVAKVDLSGEGRMAARKRAAVLKVRQKIEAAQKQNGLGQVEKVGQPQPVEVNLERKSEKGFWGQFFPLREKIVEPTLNNIKSAFGVLGKLAKRFQESPNPVRVMSQTELNDLNKKVENSLNSDLDNHKEVLDRLEKMMKKPALNCTHKELTDLVNLAKRNESQDKVEGKKTVNDFNPQEFASMIPVAAKPVKLGWRERTRLAVNPLMQRCVSAYKKVRDVKWSEVFNTFDRRA